MECKLHALPHLSPHMLPFKSPHRGGKVFPMTLHVNATPLLMQTQAQRC